jgi:hypothetical protein
MKILYFRIGFLFFFSFTCLSKIPSQTFDASLLEYWPFTSFSSASGSINGKVEGNAKISTDKNDYFLNLLDGSGRLILDKGLDLFNNFTFCFWYQPDASNVSGVIFHQKQVNGNRFFKLSFESNTLVLECSDEFGPSHYISTRNLGLIPGNRYFFSVSLKNEKLSISLNHQVIQLSEAVTLNVRESQSGDSCSFGGLGKDEMSVTGRVYDFLFFNRHLSPEEINKIFMGYWKPVEPLVTEEKVIPDIRQRSSTISGTISEIESDSILLEYFDRYQVDDDTISIYLNGNLVVEKQRVDKSKKSIKLPLQKDKDNYVTLFAENLGRVPPNTASVRIYADKKKYELNINSDFAQNGTILLRRKGP